MPGLRLVRRALGRVPGASRAWAAHLVSRLVLRLGCWPGSPELAGGRAGWRRGWPEKKRRRKKEGKRKKKKEKRKERVSSEREREREEGGRRKKEARDLTSS